MIIPFLSGCLKDCGNACTINQYATNAGGYCHCVCKQNYEGARCDTLISTKFVGAFKGTVILNDTQITSPVTFLVSYSIDDSSFLVVNNNYMVLSTDTSATLCVTIRGSNIFLPPKVNGNGCLSSDLKRLTLNYIYQYISDTAVYNYTFIGIRQ